MNSGYSVISAPGTSSSFFVGTMDGISYYKRAFTYKSDKWINELDELARPTVTISMGRTQEAILNTHHFALKAVICVDSQEDRDNPREHAYPLYYSVKTIQEALALAKTLAKKGDTVLFSPLTAKEKRALCCLEFETLYNKLAS